MKYLNQLDYPEMPYPTNADHPEHELYISGTIKRAGCGLCSACMLVEQLTLEELTLEACRDLSMKIHANHGVGTDMKILGPEIARRYGLRLLQSDSSEELRSCLQSGGAAIINVGGDHDDHVGIFSHGGHYILAQSISGEEVSILDPSWTAEKYREEPRLGKVREAGKRLYAKLSVLEEDTENRSPAYYLFQRNSDFA